MPVILWWLLLEGLGLLALPLMFPLFGPRMAHGYPFAKIVGAAGAHLHRLAARLRHAARHGARRIASALLVAAGVALAAGCSASALGDVAARRRLARDRAPRRAVDGRLSLLRLPALRWRPTSSAPRSTWTSPSSTCCSRADGMPPPDPWMSGDTINYYYFGYLMFANLMRLAPLPVIISYNLCVATIGGLGLLADRRGRCSPITRRWGLAVLGGAMSAFARQSRRLPAVPREAARCAAWTTGARRASSPKATRSTSSPSSAPSTATCTRTSWCCRSASCCSASCSTSTSSRRARRQQPRSPWRALVPFALVTFVLGAMVAISTWELPMGVLTVVVLLPGARSRCSRCSRRRACSSALRLIGVLVGVYVLFMPFYLDFVAAAGAPGSERAVHRLGVLHASRARRCAEFLTVFGLLLFPPALLVVARAWAAACRAARRRRGPPPGHRRRRPAPIVFAAMAGNAVLPLLALLLAGAFVVAYRGSDGEERAGFLLIVAGIAALLACELVFLKDSYGDKLYRMNTVFKLYFQAWTILAIAAPWALGRLLEQRWSWAPMPRAIVAAIGAAGRRVGLLSARHHARSHAARPYKTLDGNAYLRARASGRLRRHRMAARRTCRDQTVHSRGHRRSVLVLRALLEQHRPADRARLGQPRRPVARPRPDGHGAARRTCCASTTPRRSPRCEPLLDQLQGAIHHRRRPGAREAQAPGSRSSPA